jgi:5-methylcytosine-specific restriction enzyme subunit McrC
MEQIYLYEWQWEKLPSSVNPEELKQYLSVVWENRNDFFLEDKVEVTEEDESDLEEFKQGFLRFNDKRISAKNYVGFIQYNGIGINVFPKVFAKEITHPAERTEEITFYLLNWLKYSSRIKFPFSEVNFDYQKFDGVLEPFIFIFAEYTNRLIEVLPYQQFEEITEPTAFVKGRLAVKEYIKELWLLATISG